MSVPSRARPSRAHLPRARLRRPVVLGLLLSVIAAACVAPVVPLARPVPPAPDRPTPADLGRPTRLLLAGDSVGLSLGLGAGGVRDRLEIQAALRVGCGIVTGDQWIRGVRQAPPDYCPELAGEMGALAVSYDPDVALLVTGAWEVYDRWVDGRRLVVPSPDYRTYLVGRYLDAIDRLSSAGGRVVVAEVPCMGSPPLDERSNPFRVAAVNEAIAEAVAARPGVAYRVDLPAFVCPGGQYQAQMGGVTLRYDGVHYTSEGGGLVWPWLLQQAELATTPAQRP